MKQANPIGLLIAEMVFGISSVGVTLSVLVLCVRPSLGALSALFFCTFFVLMSNLHLKEASVTQSEMLSLENTNNIKETLLQMATNYNFHLLYLDEIKASDDAAHWQMVEEISLANQVCCNKVLSILQNSAPYSTEIALCEMLKQGYQEFGELKSYVDVLCFEPLSFDGLTALTGAMMQNKPLPTNELE
jgi:hypothetical protein